MKSKNPVTIITGIVLVIIFLFMVFTYQVRLTEVAVVTTFGDPKGYVTDPGLHFKLPSPIQQIYKFDNRTHNFEDKFQQSLTQDSQPLLVMLYVGWRISDPKQYFSSFKSGRPEDAESALEGLIGNAKLSVVGSHAFSHFISADPAAIQFNQIEKEILDRIVPEAKSKFGIEVRFAGIKRIGLPQSVSEAAMMRMKTERDTQVARIQGEGNRTAIQIKSDADTQSAQLLANATRDAEIIKAQAEMEVARMLDVVSKEPALYRALQLNKALPEILKGESTIIVDRNTIPYNYLLMEETNAPSASGARTPAR